MGKPGFLDGIFIGFCSRNLGIHPSNNDNLLGRKAFKDAPKMQGLFKKRLCMQEAW